MSRSLRPLNVPGDAPAGGRSGLPGGVTPSAGDIADEINDHLACRRSELEAEGIDETEAKERARRSFGDARKIAREVFWIHHGERIMSQRLLWTAIGLVLVALLANLYMQQRSTAAMNAAIAKLTEQMGRSAQPMGEARIKVVNENGEPRAGVKITLFGANPSPYLSNATYSREFESDLEGMIRTGPIGLGAYKLQALIQSEDNLRSWIFSMEGPGIQLLNNEEVVDATFTAPRATRAKVTIEPSEFADGWKPRQSQSLESWKRFGGTSAKVRVSFKFGEVTEFPLLPGADIDLYYRLERKDPNGNQRTFDAAEVLSANDPALVNGGTIRLGLPRGRFSSLTAEGKEVRHPRATQPVN